MFNFHLLDSPHVRVRVCVCTFNLGLFICLTLPQCLCKILATVSVVIIIVITLRVFVRMSYCQLTWLIVGVYSNRVEIYTNMPVTIITCSFLDYFLYMNTCVVYIFVYLHPFVCRRWNRFLWKWNNRELFLVHRLFPTEYIKRMNVFQFVTIGYVHVNASITESV